jgi:hypothetical protein
MSKLAELIAKEEGYGIPGSLPTRDNNPGDLRHSPHSFHTAAAPDAIGQIDNPADGWADLELQLQRFAERGLTLEQAVEIFAPPSENDSVGYLAYICTGLGVPATTLVSDALNIPGDHSDE